MFGVTTYIWSAEFTSAQFNVLPRLRDAYIVTLSTLAGRGELVEESRRNATIKRALKLASDRVLGPDAVKDVLLQRAWQQPL